MLLADGPGGAVEGLARRLRVAELCRLLHSWHWRVSCCEIRQRRSAVRTGRGAHRRGGVRHTRQGSWGGMLLEVIFVRSSPVGNMCRFLVSFYQESFGHLGEWRRKGTSGRRVKSRVSRFVRIMATLEACGTSSPPVY